MSDLQVKSPLLIFVIATFFIMLVIVAAKPTLIRAQIPTFFFLLICRVQKMQMGDMVSRRSDAMAKAD